MHRVEGAWAAGRCKRWPGSAGGSRAGCSPWPRPTSISLKERLPLIEIEYLRHAATELGLDDLEGCALEKLASLHELTALYATHGAHRGRVTELERPWWRRLFRRRWVGLAAAWCAGRSCDRFLLRRLKHRRRPIQRLSMEFLIGRSFANNIVNLSLAPFFDRFLQQESLDWLGLVEQEPDAGLGNGGLGRLAACLLDSMATMQLPAMGYGLRYEYGMFKQRIENGWQREQPDNRLRRSDPWEVARLDDRVEIKLNHSFSVRGGTLDVIRGRPSTRSRRRASNCCLQTRFRNRRWPATRSPPN